MDKILTPTRARIIKGSVLPPYNKLISTAQYEDFNILRGEGDNTLIHEMNATSMVINEEIDLRADKLANWSSDALFPNTSVSATNQRKVSKNGDGLIDVGRGYVTFLNKPLIQHMGSLINHFTIRLVATIPMNYQRIFVGTMNAEHTSIGSINIIPYEYMENPELEHTFEVKLLDSVAYLYIDNVYTGYSRAVSSQNTWYIGFYNPNSSPVLVRSISVRNSVDIDSAPVVII